MPPCQGLRVAARVRLRMQALTHADRCSLACFWPQTGKVAGKRARWKPTQLREFARACEHACESASRGTCRELAPARLRSTSSLASTSSTTYLLLAALYRST
eukprot:4369599-Pleurochrysis_carterae.AAC.1